MLLFCTAPEHVVILRDGAQRLLVCKGALESLLDVATHAGPGAGARSLDEAARVTGVTRSAIEAAADGVQLNPRRVPLLVVREAEGTGITLLHENEKEIYGDTPARCLDILTQIGSPTLRAAGSRRERTSPPRRAAAAGATAGR